MDHADQIAAGQKGWRLTPCPAAGLGRKLPCSLEAQQAWQEVAAGGQGGARAPGALRGAI